ncbi:hypothetical protein ACLM7Z_09425 [Butyricicoccus porcorum]
MKKKARKAVPVEAKRYAKELRKKLTEIAKNTTKSHSTMMTIQHRQRRKK